MADPTLAEVTARAYTVPTDAPEADGTLAWDSTTIVVVEVRTSDPALPCGLGWTYAPGAAVGVVDGLLGPAVAGRPVLDVPGCWEAMSRAVRNAGRTGLVMMALSAVDTAIWDLKARLLDLPLHRLFGATRDTVPVYGSGGFTTYDEARLRAQLTGWLDQGIDRVKIKIGEDRGRRTDRDLERVAFARQVVGDDTDLYVDANGGYERKQAIRIGERLDAHGVGWFEEPVSSEDLDGLRFVREHVDADVTAGEYGDRLAYFSTMLRAGAVDCLQVDVSRCGGYTEWMRICAVAAASGLSVSGHCAPGLHVPVAIATPDFRHLEWFHDHVRIESEFFDPAPVATGGSIRPTEEPGRGLVLRSADVERYRSA
ncbi:enolase C-terminal domain-like protein [Nocardioides sp. YIM 152315]|uniref:enolase C-terminal domain-like protein n=1 Tax=Nocardioides sp. YIM 152315 TaxID=3031760 RepID=UPI0023DBFFC4|nr:enolase C-terminal domain-like protein [Nocardioides sp. YIM 152315]MDF1601942.1 enolase C-terminal domain-like protein [Nocardioides sp. YIM 152315]